MSDKDVLIPPSPSEDDYVRQVTEAEPLPLLPEADPFELFGTWLKAAHESELNDGNAMALATVDADGLPDVRMVLLKGFDGAGFVFFTNYESRKAEELAANPRAAGVLHWDAFGRQVRLEGRIAKSPADESDEYFASRALDSRIGAWASLQSQPLDARRTLLKRVASEAARFGTHVPRPPHWGGYRLWPESVELWIEGPFRVHDRARWTRTVEAAEGGIRPGPWSATRLFP